jgi:predicted NAD/FAD-dependent oxidoreductase
VNGGYPVAVFDKGRRPGGRVGTRRVEGFAFDHGAQYFTTDTAKFRTTIATARQSGAIAPWGGKIVALSNGTVPTVDDDLRRWVGVPGMSTLAQHLSASLDIRCGYRIAEVVRKGNDWRLVAEDGSTVAEADLVVVAVPPPQAHSLLSGSPDLACRAAAASLAPCWAVMLGFDEPLSLPFDGAFIDGGPPAWIARDRSKPGREGSETWVLHASPSWSREHLEADRGAVSEDLLRAFRLAAGRKAPQPAYAAAHRWRYARVEASLEKACLYDPNLRIGACGDWCLGGKIEAAFLSGRAMAQRIAENLGSVAPANPLDHKE